MLSDDLEFLIAQHADGTLDPGRVAEVEAVLRRYPRAREVLESYRAIDGALADGRPVPAVRWDRLADRINRRVAVLAASPPLTEEVEEQISRCADGTLPAAEARLIEARVGADPQARLVLGEYAALDRLFAAERADVPDVRWDALAEHLSGAIDAAHAPAESYKLFAAAASGGVGQAPVVRRSVTAGRTGVLGRIGKWATSPRRLAVAACLLVAGTASFQLIRNGGGPSGVGPTPPAVTGDPAPGNGAVAGGPGPSTPGQTIVIPFTPPIALPPTDRSAVADVQVVPPPAGADPADPARPDYARGQGTSSIASDRAAMENKAASRDSGSVFPH